LILVTILQFPDARAKIVLPCSFFQGIDRQIFQGKRLKSAFPLENPHLKKAVSTISSEIVDISMHETT